MEQQISDRAKVLLRKLVEVEGWVKKGDPRADPYLKADAVRNVDGTPQFHRERFIAVYTDELIRERNTHGN